MSTPTSNQRPVRTIRGDARADVRLARGVKFALARGQKR
jgi:hypothetical protein